VGTREYNSASIVQTHYLNAEFDLGLRPRPKQIEGPALVRQVRELSLQALLGAEPGDAALVRADPPPEFIDYLNRCGFETPRLLAHPEIDTAAELRPFGWSAEAIELNGRYDTPVPHPAPAIIRKVNARSFGRRLEERISADPPAGAIVDGSEALAQFVSGTASDAEWIVKAEYGHSGLGNRRLRGPCLSAADGRFIADRLREDDRLVVERWLPRERDYCTVFEVPYRPDTARIHETINTRDGALIGALFDPRSENDESQRRLLQTAELAASSLTDEGYFGPVCMDGFVWNDDGRPRLRTLVDLNCRLAMSDAAWRLWQRNAPRAALYYRFFNRGKLRIPDEVPATIEAFGDQAYDAHRQRGILLASPLQIGSDGEWRRPTKLAVIFVGDRCEQVLAQEAWFRERFEG